MEFKSVMKTFADMIPDSDRKMKEAVYDYINYDADISGQMEELLESFSKMFSDVTWDIFKGLVGKNMVEYVAINILNWINEGILLSSGVALGTVFTGVSLGLCLSDVLCNSSEKSAEFSKVVAMSEFSPYIIEALKFYESKLYSDRDDTAVAEFEYAFALHKATQSYIMEHTIEALRVKSNSIVIWIRERILHRNDYDALISEIIELKKVIDEMKCHSNSNQDSNTVKETKVIAIKCPVDVFVYDENGSEIVRIINDTIEDATEGLYVFVEDSAKYLLLPANQDYSVKIIATEEGQMEYFVTEFGEGAERLRTIKTSEIPLVVGREFTGKIAASMEVSPDDYALIYDDVMIEPDEVISVPVTGIELDIHDFELQTGETTTLTVTVSPGDASNKNVTWVSDNPNVVMVDNQGNITALASGVAAISVSSDDWGYIETCIVTVADSPMPQHDGDVDGDGEITTADALIVLRGVLGINSLTDEQQIHADVNDNNVINTIDALIILRIALRLIQP